MLIGRIFNRIFGRQEAPQRTTETEQSAPQPAAEPQDTREPELPVEPGLHYVAVGDGPFSKSLQLKATTLEHLWSGEASRDEVQNAFERISWKVLREKNRDNEIQELIAEDQSPSDFDGREGHVVIPDKNFEYHGDLESVKYPPSGGKPTREGNIFTDSTKAGLAKYDSESKKFHFLPNQTKQIEGTTFGDHSRTIQSSDFRITEEGAVILPTATNLEDAKKLVEKRELAEKAQWLLDYAEKVRETVDYRIDNRDGDHDSRPGHALADKIDEYWFLRDNSLPHMKHQTYSVEQGPNSVRLYEDSYNKKPELILKAVSNGPVTDIEFAQNDGHESLHVRWDKSTGTVSAEHRQSEAYQPPAPKPQPVSYGSSERSYYQPPRPPERPRDLLPQGFTSSDRMRSHGGGHHVMVKSETGNPHDYNYPESFRDPSTGKTYRKTTYVRGSSGGGLERMYVEDRG